MSFSYGLKNNVIGPLALCSITAVLLLTSTALSAEMTYGPIKANDTLSKIINRTYTGSKSTRLSIMKQIVINNPNAFMKGDMNRLKLNTSLVLPGTAWRNVIVSQSAATLETEGLREKKVVTDLVNRSAPELTIDQMKGRIVFLDAERSSLLEQVSDLRRETLELKEKVLKLESDSQQSDEQLRILDAEIIRLTQLLKSNEVSASSIDLNQLVALQEKLNIVQQETSALRNELASTKNKLTANSGASEQANRTIQSLTQENNQLKKRLQAAQPGVNYYSNTAEEHSLSLWSENRQLPLGLIVVVGVLALLMLTALLATRKKNKQPSIVTKEKGTNPFEDTQSFARLLETETETSNSRGFAQTHTQPEENVFKMFDEGSLEMDLKLDMAEAYLQVSDIESARAILQEVVKGGSELQKRKATRLINKAA